MIMRNSYHQYYQETVVCLGNVGWQGKYAREDATIILQAYATLTEGYGPALSKYVDPERRTVADLADRDAARGSAGESARLRVQL